MNITRLNTLNDDKVIIRGNGGNSGGGVVINNQDKTVDIVENGTLEVIADSGFTGLGTVSVNVNVPSSGGGTTPSSPKWTGHADVEGLKAIGWTDEDIAYYQENGVNWNEEDDEYHKVSDDNKALYEVLTADNISTYKDRIVYLPKIDTSNKDSLSGIFQTCYALVSIPMLDTSNATNFSSMFKNCYSLISIPQLDTSKATTLNSMFYGCRSIVHIPLLNTSSVTNTGSLFYGCFSLTSIPPLDLSSVVNADAMFYNCYSVVDVPHLNIGEKSTISYSINSIFYNCNSITKISIYFNSNSAPTNPFYNCYALSTVLISNYYGNWQLVSSPLLNKESLLFIINNINNHITGGNSSIKLHVYAYTRLANDADIVAALAAHPNISISQ